MNVSEELIGIGPCLVRIQFRKCDVSVVVYRHKQYFAPDSAGAVAPVSGGAMSLRCDASQLLRVAMDQVTWVRLFVAQAVSRPLSKAMLEKIRDGATLVSSKLDRLGRHAQDVSATIKMLNG